jgi:hypothetical protein
MYGNKTQTWSNFSVLYKTADDNAWTDVTNLTVTKSREPGGFGGKYTNELSFTPVSARWWKVWSGNGGGVISVYEFEVW